MTQTLKNKFFDKKVYVFYEYIFVCFDLSKILWIKINFTHGILKILHFNSKTVEVSSDLILELKIEYEDNDNLINKRGKVTRGW